MELLNATPLSTGYTLGLAVDGRQHLVVVAKGTFAIPTHGGPPALADRQMPLIEADVFAGEPGASSLIYEIDFAPVKPRCDVVVNGTVYAPHGKPTTRATVSVSVAGMNKSLEYHGNRTWVQNLGKVMPSMPQPFVSMPISYERAYGGVDADPDDPATSDVFAANPIGVGHYPLSRRRSLVGKPLPNTAEIGRPVESATGAHRPMALGAIGRDFSERIRLAGTYDSHWFEHIFPFLPADFDCRYYQCAPADQQIAHPLGGERVELVNLTPQGRVTFELPRMDVPIEFTDRSATHHEVRAVLDTIVIEPDRRWLSLTWRASRPLRRDVFEIVQVVVGRMPSGWYRARSLGKSYYPRLSDLVDKEED